MARLSVYASILEDIFFSKFREGMTQVDFERSDITLAAERRGVKVPRHTASPGAERTHGDHEGA